MMAPKHVSRWWSSKAPKDQESNNKIKKLENLNVIGTGDGSLCYDELDGGDICFDDLDIDWFMGYLDFDQEINNKMNLEGSGRVIDGVGIGGGNNLEESRTLTAESFIVMDSTAVGDCSAADQCETGGFCFDDLGGDLCYNDFDIDLFMRCLDSDKQEEPVNDNTIRNVVRRKFKIGDQELHEFGGGLCFDDLGCGDLCLDDFDINWFMGYLDSDKENNKMIDSDVGNNLEESRASNLFIMDIGVADCSVADQCEIGVQEFGGGFCLDDLRGGDLCFDEESNFDIDWFMRCLDSDQKADPVEHGTNSKLGKRKFDTEGNSNQTKRTCL